MLLAVCGLKVIKPKCSDSLSEQKTNIDKDFEVCK